MGGETVLFLSAFQKAGYTKAAVCLFGFAASAVFSLSVPALAQTAPELPAVSGQSRLVQYYFISQKESDGQSFNSYAQRLKSNKNTTVKRTGSGKPYAGCVQNGFPRADCNTVCINRLQYNSYCSLQDNGLTDARRIE
jgi:hypothetical protein